MKGEIKEVYICLDRSLFVKKETGDNLARKGKATHMADHGVSQAAFFTRKK